jgi:hypothetical protein
LDATLGRAGWRKSSYSNGTDSCVDVDFTHNGVEIRHSRHPEGVWIVFTREQWQAWLVEVMSDAPTNTNGAVTVAVESGGWVVRSLLTGDSLRFDDHEIVAFRRGAEDGEFEPAAALAGVIRADLISQ